ncbi:MULTISPECIES: lasso RiPP family leader peptide-containing protein [unclassified Frankia]
MKATYLPPRLEDAGSFAAVTNGRWGWGCDYFWRRFA